MYLSDSDELSSEDCRQKLEPKIKNRNDNGRARGAAENRRAPQGSNHGTEKTYRKRESRGLPPNYQAYVEDPPAESRARSRTRDRSRAPKAKDRPEYYGVKPDE